MFDQGFGFGLCNDWCGRFVVEVLTLETPARAVTYELALPDYHAMVKHVCAPRPSERLLFLGAVFVASFCMVLFGRSGKAFLAGMVAGFLLMFLRALLIQLRLQPQPGRAVLCRHDVQLTERGVHLETPNWVCDLPWHGIVAVEETAAHCFLRIDTVSAYVIPKRSFSNHEAMRQFVDFACGRVSRARASGSPRA